MEQINIEKRNKLKKWGLVTVGTVFGLVAAKDVLADIYVGQTTKQETHIWRNAKYNGSLTRDGSNRVATVTNVRPMGNEVITITRDGSGYITSYVSVYDSTTVTVNITRDGSNRIQSWSVS